MKYGTRIQGHASLRISVPKALPQHMRGPIVELSALRTDPEHRSMGDATALMLATTVEADLANRLILIHVEPDEEGPLDTSMLANWYAKFGFVPIQADPLLMVRPCIATLNKDRRDDRPAARHQ